MLANEQSVASVCALIKIILETISPIAECGVRLLHVDTNLLYVVGKRQSCCRSCQAFAVVLLVALIVSHLISAS